MTSTVSNRPIVLTAMWRFRPLIFFPASYPRADTRLGAFAESLGFVAVGSVMIFVLFGAA